MFVGMLLSAALWVQEAAPVDDAPPDPFAWLEVPAKESPRKQRWLGDLAKARAEARARNCPLLLVIAEDHAAGFRTADTTVLSHSRFTKLTHRCVVVAAIGGRSLPIERKRVHGVMLDWCERFQMPVQLRHMAYEKAALQYLRREYWQPAYVLVQPDGEEYTRVEGHKHQTGDVEELVEELQAEIGRDLSLEDYRAALAAARKIVDRREKTGRGASLDALNRLQRGWSTAGLTDVARRIENQMLAEGRAAVTAARARFEAGEEEAALEDLDELVDEWGEREPGSRAAKLRRELGRR